MTHILDEILTERVRQHQLWGDQTHLPDGTENNLLTRATRAVAVADCDQATSAGTLTFWHILAEEIAEVRAETNPMRLRAELIQVAAVCLQWIEAIDTKAGAT